MCRQGLAEGEEAEEVAVEVDEEEDGVAAARLIAIHAARPGLQCALGLNLARCSLQAQDCAPPPPAAAASPALSPKRRCLR